MHQPKNDLPNYYHQHLRTVLWIYTPNITPDLPVMEHKNLKSSISTYQSFHAIKTFKYHFLSLQFTKTQKYCQSQIFILRQNECCDTASATDSLVQISIPAMSLTAVDYFTHPGQEVMHDSNTKKIALCSYSGGETEDLMFMQAVLHLSQGAYRP